jgi:hypothetical protein
MSQTKTLHEREKELQQLLATKDGRAELESLAALYCATSGKAWSEGTSIVTYLIVHERQKGLIAG